MNKNIIQLILLLVLVSFSRVGFSCSENHEYPPAEVHVASLKDAWEGDINEYLNNRYGKSNWKWDKTNNITITTIKHVEHPYHVPVTIELLYSTKNKKMEVIEAGKFNHVVSNFKFEENIESVQFRYKRPEKRSKLYVVFGSNDKYLVKEKGNILFGGFSCSGTKYVYK